MMNPKIGIFAALLLGFTIGCSAASNSPLIHVPDGVTLSKSPLNPTQSVLSGQGLNSLLAELARMGVDPNKLNVTLPNGTFVTPFTPGVTDIKWQRTLTAGAGVLHPYNLADGTGTPGEVENDTFVYAHYIVVYTWMYMKLADGSYGWVAVGFSTFPVPTQKQ